MGLGGRGGRLACSLIWIGSRALQVWWDIDVAYEAIGPGGWAMRSIA